MTLMWAVIGGAVGIALALALIDYSDGYLGRDLRDARDWLRRTILRGR